MANTCTPSWPVVTLTLPPLTPAQADALLAVLDALQGALYAAYEDALLAADAEASAAAQEAHEQAARDE